MRVSSWMFGCVGGCTCRGGEMQSTHIYTHIYTTPPITHTHLPRVHIVPGEGAGERRIGLHAPVEPGLGALVQGQLERAEGDVAEEEACGVCVGVGEGGGFGLVGVGGAEGG